MSYRFLATFLLLSVSLSACSPDAAVIAAATPNPTKASVTTPISPRSVELTDTYVHDLTANGTERNYEVWVSVPASYSESDKDYPVVFVTDAGYSFPLVRSIRNLLGQRGRNIEDFILVGIPPQPGLTSKQSRSRDYTPSNPLLNPKRDPNRYGDEQYGEADIFLDFIANQVFPVVDTHYRADMTRKVFAGHSYGGLLGSYTLVTRPEMFQSYILGSPSLWFDNGHVFDIEAAYAASNDNLKAKVFMLVGMYETTGQGPRYFRNTDMIGDMHRFEKKLRDRKYPSLVVESAVLEGEDHLTVFPNLISRGLLWALPGHGPYTSG